jgi:DNA polymerase delta subunit 2
MYHPFKLCLTRLCREAPSEPLTRTNPPVGDVSIKREAFTVANRTYKQQYASMYFLRLSVLKDYCVNACSKKWATFNVAGQQAKQIERVLDIRQGELGWVVGTIYMDLPLKPNVLEDLARDVIHVRDVS